MKKLLLLILVLGLAFRLLFAQHRIIEWSSKHRSILKKLGTLLCGTLIVLTIVGGLLAARTERVGNHDESSVLSIAAAFKHGQQMYPSATAPVEYSLLYGPSTYLLYVPPMFLGATRIGFYQLWAVLALACTFVVVFFIGRSYGLRELAGLALPALFATFVSSFIDLEWGIKGDVWISLCSGLGMLAALRAGKWLGPVVIGLAGAVLVDLKFPLCFLALLPCVLLYQRGKQMRVPAVLAAVLIPLLSVLPFTNSAISLPGYMEQLHEATHHGITLFIFRMNAPYFLFLLLPGLALFWTAHARNPDAALAWARHRAVFLMLFAVTFLVATITGAKRGAGPWHALAIVMPLVLICAELWKVISEPGDSRIGWSSRSLAPVATVLTMSICFTFLSLRTAMKQRRHDLSIFEQVAMPAVEREVIKISKQYPNETLQMGYSDLFHYNLTFVRPILQLRGSPLFIDADARNEGDLISKPVSPAVLDALDRCVITLWLIPKGGTPFSLDSLYYLDRSITEEAMYPAAFQQHFLARYERVRGDFQYFDLWQCRSMASR